jgi:hypothetical protein
MSVAAAMILESYWPVVAGLAFAVVHNVWAWRRVELFPISEESAKTAARISWWFLIIGVLLRVFSN